MLGQKVGHYVKWKENLLTTLDEAIFVLAVIHFVRMFVLIKSRLRLNIGIVGIKHR